MIERVSNGGGGMEGAVFCVRRSAEKRGVFLERDLVLDSDRSGGCNIGECLQTPLIADFVFLSIRKVLSGGDNATGEMGESRTMGEIAGKRQTAPCVPHVFHKAPPHFSQEKALFSPSQSPKRAR